MAIVRMRVENDRSIERALSQLGHRLGPKAEQRVTRRALKAGGAVILKRAKQLAPRGKRRNLRRSLAVTRGRRIRRYPTGNLIAVLGPSWPLGAHGHLVEEGTRRRRTKKAHADRGVMPANPFLEPAVRAKRVEAFARVRTEIRKGIDREWDRHVRHQTRRG